MGLSRISPRLNTMHTPWIRDGHPRADDVRECGHPKMMNLGGKIETEKAKETALNNYYDIQGIG